MLSFKMKSTRFLVYVIFLFFILSGHLVRIDAKSHKKNKKKHVSPPSSENPDSSGSNIFNVMNYGAKGDGEADDTDALSKAWADACGAGNPTMLVPSSRIFLVKQVSFSGNCRSRMVFQLDGKIIAPTNGDGWGLQWLEFTGLEKGLTICGKGTIDGNGDAWWTHGGPKPTALRVADSKDVIVTGITIQNSQQTHLKFDNCVGAEVYGITISSPGNSPNTDGIHLQNSQNVDIHDNKIGCGDDCISIQTGCSAININNVRCGPSHGISIGSLGKDGSWACVSNVTVTDCFITHSQNGLRIKTWQGGAGSVHGVLFANIEVDDVDNPIVIDQNYCGGSDHCSYKQGAVAVSDVSFSNIHGSYNSYTVNLACSQDVPCNGITLSSIYLKSKQGNVSPFCENAYGKEDSTGHCLHSGGPSSSSKQSYSGNVC